MGFTPKYTTVTIEAPASVAPYQEGAEPLRADIRVTLSRREMKSFTEFTPDHVDWERLGALLSPFIVAWNLDTPPPAEVGFDAFDDVTNAETVWLLQRVAEVIREANVPRPPEPPNAIRAAC